MNDTAVYTPLIMVIDDDWINRELMQTMLTKVGYRTSSSATGEAALKELRLSGSRPDLVILDVRLADMSGFDVCHRIKQQPDTREIPVIMVSAMDTDIVRKQAQDAGAELFLSKFITLPELVQRLQFYLKKSV
jgi:CheY-like chemotaxis protein